MGTLSELLEEEGDELQGETGADKDALRSCFHVFVSFHKNMPKI